MNAQGQYGTPVKATATASGTATASITGATGVTYYITDVSGSSDLSTSTIQIKDGSTVIWQGLVGSTVSYTMSFSTPLKCTSGATPSVVVTATSSGQANFSGYSTP